MRARSLSLLMSLSAIALVWSGVSRCLVSATSLPLIRARKTSPALMCRSEAPRSTAALMIFSMLPRVRVGAAALIAQRRQEPHAPPHLAHGLAGQAPSRGGAIAQHLLDAPRILLQTQGPLADRSQGLDYVVRQLPLAIETAPLGASARIRHTHHRLRR